ncbi:c-type cytochrome [Sinomicrobium weinanense]|uniref:Cytochrome c n=1 Tax=Sinomicrobium weinanense TaxID=2842200 RepID=A0A926JVX9_9FLAO|nr:cytochrome c [Sinomicrobium weinanense]MBC9798314.1 cytochrome c [Sinomicrobium weinanense]MBU3121779.1 cytochrome c [Sinomicrobium weinanense]
MSTIEKTMLLLFGILLTACGGTPEKKEKFTYERTKTEKKVKAEDQVAKNKAAADITSLDNKGIGPVKNVTLGAEIDQAMARAGKELFKSKCMLCHKPDRKFIGPAPQGVLDRRSPEWVMNMILNPEVMVKEDPIAKQLLMDYNGSPMANQGLTEEEARKILEYFRTL